MNRALVCLLLLFLSVPAFGGALSQYTGWDQSPQGLFMTSAERDAWKRLANDTDAEAFVTAFLAKRSPKFATEVAERAAMADKYLTIGKTKGATTLRGKLVILFGPPANIQVADRKGKKGFVPPPSSVAVTDLGGSASARSGDGSTQSLGTSRPGELFRDYTFTFPSTAAKAFEGKDYVVEIEADAGTGTDRLKNARSAADLESKFEAVAEASIVK